MSHLTCDPRPFWFNSFELPPEAPPCFRGCRNKEGPNTVIGPDGRQLPLYLNVFNHSPTGFEWGYGGSGPAQTGLAILIEYLTADGDDYARQRAVSCHQDFKWEVIAHLPAEWSLPVSEVSRWVNAQPWLLNGQRE